MKKTLLYGLALMATMFGFTSCSDEQHTDTTITYYVVLDMQGEEFVEVPVGTTYTDAGCKAELDGEDYTSNIVTEGLDGIDVNTPGLYTVTYSAVSPDGYSSSVERTVAVCDPSITTDLSGTYTVQSGSYRLYNGSTKAYSGYTVTISKAASGIFYVSDYLGGWYDQRAGYGSNYACWGYMQLLEDNSLVCLSSYVNGWGDSLEDGFEGTYDPEAGTITWDAIYTTYPFVFHVILN